MKALILVTSLMISSFAFADVIMPVEKVISGTEADQILSLVAENGQSSGRGKLNASCFKRDTDKYARCVISAAKESSEKEN